MSLLMHLKFHLAALQKLSGPTSSSTSLSRYSGSWSKRRLSLLNSLHQGEVDLGAEIVKAEKRIDVAKMGIDRIQKHKADPAYEVKISEEIKQANEEKVRLGCYHPFFHG